MIMIIITHAGYKFIAAGVGYCVQSRLSVCLFVRALKGKRLDLSAPNLQDFGADSSMAGPRHALTLKSKGQRSNPNPSKWQQVQSKLTFALRGSACRYDCTFL